MPSMFYLNNLEASCFDLFIEILMTHFRKFLFLVSYDRGEIVVKTMSNLAFIELKLKLHVLYPRDVRNQLNRSICLQRL